MGEVGMTAFIVAEMEDFVNGTMVGFDSNELYGQKWSLNEEDLIQTGMMTMITSEDKNGTSVPVRNEEYLQATEDMKENGALAIELICNATQTAFLDGFQTGLLTALGSAILFFRNYYRTPTLLAACERVGLSDYQVAHHITDMYHHRTFRGAYTKTLAASGKGEIASRIAVGLDAIPTKKTKQKSKNRKGEEESELEESELEDEEEDDECICWSPTTPGLCLKWKSEDEAWRKTRFERIQMEGTKDPRRGGSGGTR